MIYFQTVLLPSESKKKIYYPIILIFIVNIYIYVSDALNTNNFKNKLYFNQPLSARCV